MATQLDVKILYLKPKLPPSNVPIVDSITRKLAAALRRPLEEGAVIGEHFFPNNYSFGCYKCTCGKAAYAAQDFRISEELITNSVALHYIAYHRIEVSVEEISLIDELEAEEEPDRSSLELQ